MRLRDVRFFIGAVACFTLASRALAVAIGFQIYRITHNPLSLGLLGLIEAIPALSLVPFGGYVADHFNRKKILLVTRGVSVVCAVSLAVFSWRGGEHLLWGLYAAIFAAGIARGFADPASTALEALVVPRHLTVSASSWISSTWVLCAAVGPAVIGFIFDGYGDVASYAVIALFFALSWIATLFIIPRPQAKPEQKEPIFKSIGMGWHFVLNNQSLLGAMMLDLFAVLFGGAIALLPVYAEDILHVGARGLGLLNAAPSLGALLIMLWATTHAPMKKAGRNLLWAVTLFGVSMIVFALSRNFYLSLVALFFSGVFDGISVVIRRSMLRLLSPDYLRGRIAAVNMVFIASSNELGAFQSGVMAAWIGAVPAVTLGGFVTLAVVGLASLGFPKLRSLKFNLEHHP